MRKTLGGYFGCLGLAIASAGAFANAQAPTLAEAATTTTPAVVAVASAEVEGVTQVQELNETSLPKVDAVRDAAPIANPVKAPVAVNAPAAGSTIARQVAETVPDGEGGFRTETRVVFEEHLNNPDGGQLNYVVAGPGGELPNPGRGPTREDRETENKIQQMLGGYAQTKDESVKKSLSAEIRALLADQFARRQEVRAKELADLEAEVARLREIHTKRQAESERIIDDRLSFLLRESSGLGWGSHVDHPNGPPPVRGGGPMPPPGSPGPAGPPHQPTAPSFGAPAGPPPQPGVPVYGTPGGPYITGQPSYTNSPPGPPNYPNAPSGPPGPNEGNRRNPRPDNRALPNPPLGVQPPAGPLPVQPVAPSTAGRPVPPLGRGGGPGEARLLPRPPMPPGPEARPARPDEPRRPDEIRRPDEPRRPGEPRPPENARRPDEPRREGRPPRDLEAEAAVSKARELQIQTLENQIRALQQQLESQQHLEAQRKQREAAGE